MILVSYTGNRDDFHAGTDSPTAEERMITDHNIKAEPAEDDGDDKMRDVAAALTAKRRGRCATCYAAASSAKAGRQVTKVGEELIRNFY
jgi:hypothetical protein